MPVIKAEYGPTLPQLLAPRPPAVRAGAAALAGAILLAAALIALTSRADATEVLVRAPVTFNLIHGKQWDPVQRRGALVALRNTGKGGLFLDAYTIRELRLPSYRGVVSGTLPVYADSYVRRIRGRYKAFEQLGEGRARINNAIGYEVTFRARLGTRRLYGRHYLLVEEEPDGVRRGVVLELESTPAAGTPSAVDIGNHGALKTPLRSFRFGESREGGTA
ncbi:MAG: hypothetical protein AVDCRST_MAG67-4389 [uncultured Solirubrobacteraceae bacterium]|uniref:Uncharacterized protein n=1 Tax=uncultured Solirubrobacteraceae bacterium TaxID=1162706 RepID=A0A6J4TVR9_9ACTN|nr:MAG: hypothetical protein AVDCRST_MAG67-4389 [uncultured Solirubrobacteraceae bacterium]